MVRLFALTLSLSAFLLFYYQPMIGKMALPVLGGAASVWATCIVFFQTMLLAGYVYAHGVAKLAGFRQQAIVHCLVMAAALVFLPVRFGPSPGVTMPDQPALWLFLQLMRTAGLPFFVVSTTAPLLQAWFSKTSLKAGRDPYFLYAASNAGSLLSLLLYPFLLEPYLGVRAQSSLWLSGYIVLFLMIIAAAISAWRHSPAPRNGVDGLPFEVEFTAAPAWRSRAYWTAAAFLPSALMLAVTNHVSVNLSPAPLLWIVPLAVYLLTFILAFNQTTGLSPARLSLGAPMVLLLLLPVVPDTGPATATLNLLLLAGHVGLLFFAGLLCHSALAARRPHPRHLTDFYFWIAFGGAAGGLFTAILAPRIFSTVLEYPLLVALLPFFIQSRVTDDGRRWGDWIYPALVATVFVAAWRVSGNDRFDASTGVLALLTDIILFLAVLGFQGRRLRFALGFMALVVGYSVTMPHYVEQAERLYVARNFFGVKKVVFDLNQNARKLLHGDTMHGLESMNPLQSGEPLSYYHPSGPVGDVMEVLAGRPAQQAGIVGLGTGTMAAYAGEDRRMTFFDIDPQVEWIALRFFTFLRRCGSGCEVVVGDGRLSLAQQPDHIFDLLMLDAFSSDSIPAHLLSREALRVYLSKLKPDGILLFHVSNRYLNVEKLVAAAIADARLVGLVRHDSDDRLPGKTGSDYVAAARRNEHLGPLDANDAWQPLPPDTEALWTDDYSNILGLIRWR